MVRLPLLALLAAAAAHAADPSDFERYFNAGVRLYQSLEYERALDQFDKARKYSRGPDDDVQVGLYEGVVQFELGHLDESRAAFKTALLLKPDAQLPLKVAPKLKNELEQLRVKVKAELAPLLAKEEAERKRREDEVRKADDAKKAAAEEARKAEEARRAGEAKQAADEKKRADEELKKAEQLRAEAAALAEQTKKADDARKALDARKKAEDARRNAEAAASRAENAERRVEQLEADRPVEARLVPADTGASTADTGLTQAPPSKGSYLPSIVLLGLGAAAGGVGAYFGLTMNDEVSKAKRAMWQTDTVAHLSNASADALVADVLFAVAAAAGIAALIALFAGG